MNIEDLTLLELLKHYLSTPPWPNQTREQASFRFKIENEVIRRFEKGQLEEIQ